MYPGIEAMKHHWLEYLQEDVGEIHFLEIQDWQRKSKLDKMLELQKLTAKKKLIKNEF